MKDKVLGKLHNELESKNKLYVDENKNIIAPSYTPFVDQNKDIDRLTLYSFKGPFELLHADITYKDFLANLAVDRKYCLLFVDLFTSKIFMCPMRSRTLLGKKIELFL